MDGLLSEFDTLMVWIVTEYGRSDNPNNPNNHGNCRIYGFTPGQS